MFTDTPLADLFQALSQGLEQPRHAWQLGVVVAAFVLALALVHLARRFWRVNPGANKALGAVTLLQPLLHAWQPATALILMALGESVLRHFQVLHSRTDAHLMHLAMTLTLAWMLVRLLLSILRQVVGQTALAFLIERVIKLSALIGLVLYATGLLDDAVAWMAATDIPFGNSARVSLWSLLVGSTTTVTSLLVALWLGALVEARLAAQDGLEPNVRTMLSRVLRGLLLFAALIVGLALSGIDLTILSVFGGALGVGLGLGLQRVASNYVSGFILLLDHSLRIGDFIAVDKYYGRVTQINTRCTVLRSTDGTDAVVPNEMLLSSPVSNLTLNDPKLSLTTSIALDAKVSLPLAMQVMTQAAATVPRVLSDPAPSTLFREMGSGVIWLDVNFWIQDPQNGRQRAQSDVAVAVIEALRAQGIALGVQQQISVSAEPGAE